MGVKIDPASFKALMGRLGCGWPVLESVDFAMLQYVALPHFVESVYTENI